MSSVTELRDISITKTWRALGGGEIRHNRANAFWRRDANSYSLSLDPDRNVWFDFVSNAGGGVLDLVMVALACDKRDAIYWLVDNCGLIGHRDTRTPAERAQTRREAQERDDYEASLMPSYREHLAKLVADRDRLIGELRNHDDDRELELKICYSRIDAARKALGDDVPEDAANFTMVVIDLLAEVQEREAQKG